MSYINGHMVLFLNNIHILFSFVEMLKPYLPMVSCILMKNLRNVMLYP